MILDNELKFSDSQAVTSAAASTNSVDLGAVRDIGTGEDLYVVVTVDVELADSGSNSTLDVVLRGDSTSTFTPDATQTLFTIPQGAAAGSQYFAKLDPASAPLQLRYIQLYYSPNNGDLSAGSVSAYLTNNIQRYVSYPDGFTIS